MMAIHDRQLDSYINIFPMQSVGQALRGFSDEVNNPDSDMHKHPEDYTLYQVGTFDKNSGQLLEERKQVALATNVLVKRQ